MYNLIDNYVDSSGSLYQFQRDESTMNEAENPLNVALENSTYSKYKASLLGKVTDTDGNDRSLKNTKIVIPLKYLSNFFRSIEMLIIEKQHIKSQNCMLQWSLYQLKIM